MPLKTLTSLIIVCSLAGCGGSPPEPAETPPKSESASEAPPPASEEQSSESSEKKEGAKDDEESSESSSKEPAKPTRSAKEILTTEGMLFSFSFKDSDVYQKAEKECADKSGGDNQKKADCMTKAGASVEADAAATGVAVGAAPAGAGPIAGAVPAGPYVWSAVTDAPATIEAIRTFETRVSGSMARGERRGRPIFGPVSPGPEARVTGRSRPCNGERASSRDAHGRRSLAFARKTRP